MIRSAKDAPVSAEHPYARQLIEHSAQREVLVMTWRPGATCAPHDHGERSGGVVHLVVGELVERRYVFDGELRVVASRRHVAPAVLEVEPGLIHDMHAPGAATTVHVYTPSVERMRVYDAARRTTWIVPDDHGAWVPHEPAALSRDDWR